MIQVMIVGPEERVDYEPLPEALSAEDISLLQAAFRYDRAAGTAYDPGLRLFVSAVLYLW